MKFKNIGIILLSLGLLFAIAYFVRTNSKSAIEYETTNPFISSIELTSVVTGKVIPEDEVEIKPQLNGIIEKILVEEGDTVLNSILHFCSYFQLELHFVLAKLNLLQFQRFVLVKMFQFRLNLLF